MGKSQTQIDAFSTLPVDPGEEVRAVIDLSPYVQEELREIILATKQGYLVHPDLVSLEGYSFDTQVHIVVGPVACQHLMDVLLRTPGNQLGSLKLLAKFWEHYITDGDRKVAEAVTRGCPRCQRGTDYRPTGPPAGHITAERPWHTVSIDVMGHFPTT